MTNRTSTMSCRTLTALITAMAFVTLVVAGCVGNIGDTSPESEAPFTIESFFQFFEHRNVKMVEQFLKRGMDVNSRDSSEETALLIAVKNDDVEMLQLLVKAGADLKARYRYGNSILAEAVDADVEAAVQALIDVGAELEAKNKRGEPPLFLAASLGRKATPILIRAGADLNVKNDMGETALMVAAMVGEIASVRMLIEAKADVNIANAQGKTALIDGAGMWRSRMQSFKVDEATVTAIVELLLAAGANVKAKTTDEGMTALLAAASEGHADAATLLIKAGADVNAKTKVDAFTPLMEAAKGRYGDVVKVLLQAGADPKRKDRVGRTAANWGADYPEIVALLGGKPSSAKPTGKSAAVKKVTPEQQEQAKQTLVKLGYREFTEDMFMNSVYHGELEAVKAFLDYGLSVDSKSSSDHATTPLLAAATLTTPEVGLFLIKAGANVNAKDVNGATPLIWATQKPDCGMKALVQALVDAGADVNAKAAGGATPLMMAEVFKCTEIIKILKKAGAKE